MSSTLLFEARWFFFNCVILVVLGFAISAGQGTILLLASPDGSIPGWGGTPIEQLFWYALGGALLVVVPFGIPVLAIALFAWRLIVRTIGRPRLSAFLEATVIVVAAAVLIPRASPSDVVLWLGMPLVVYAALVRLPRAAG